MIRPLGRPIRLVLTLFALHTVLNAPLVAAAAITAEQEQLFEQRVRPVLANRCFSCHGPDAQESGLRLDSLAALKAGGDSGHTLVVPGRAEESVLIAAVKHEGELQMPPDERIPDAEIEALVAWINMGLPWPSSETAPPPAATQEERYDLARQTHWAYQPVVRPELPAVSRADWPRTPLDTLVLAKLESAGLQPSAEADRRTLIRRVTFDLLGLPPTPSDVENFLNDSSPDAYERLVDRLLASPHYGERWGRHWLDVARYADTRGYAFGRERRYPYSYTYRDYVIRAMNEDLPYDRFVLEQLAADRLELAENDPALAGMGFLTVGRKFNNFHDDVDDQIDVVSRGLLGITVSCARCHDHKYDAIPTEDYYSLYGVFASSQEPEMPPVIGRPEDTPGYAEFKQQLDKLKQDVEDFRVKTHARLRDEARAATSDYLVRAVSAKPEEAIEQLPYIKLKNDALKTPLVGRWKSYLDERMTAEHPIFGLLFELTRLPEEAFSAQAAQVLERWQGTPDGLAPGQLNPRVKEAFAGQPPATKEEAARRLGEAIEQAYGRWKEAGADEAAAARLPEADRQLVNLLLADDSPTAFPLNDLNSYYTRKDREDQRDLEKKVDSHQVNSPGAPPRAMVLVDKPQPQEPHVLIRGNPGRRGDRVPRQFLYVLAGPEREPFQRGSGRLELAREIVAPDNPLTRRVIANRIWMHHFDQPLVDTPSDFGARSQEPVQRALLDYLAARLLTHGWSLKSLHREIVLSATYRQASVYRDECARTDPENRLLWRMNRRRLEFEPMRDALFAVAGNLDKQQGGRPVELTTEPFSRRRAVYGFIDRQDLPGIFRVFDFASPDQSSAGRPKTTVAQQALFMMNSPLVIQQAKALAARPEVSGADTGGQIDALYRLLYARTPDHAERQMARRFLDAAHPPSDQVRLTPLEQFAQLLLLSNEFIFVD